MHVRSRIFGYIILGTQVLALGSAAPFPNRSPDCGDAFVAPAVLTPADRTFRTLSIDGLTDLDGDALRVAALYIIQNEPTGSLFQDDEAPDAFLHPLQVRAERWDHGTGRIYTIGFRAEDGRGGVCYGRVTVCGPLHDGGDCTDRTPFARGFDATYLKWQGPQVTRDPNELPEPGGYQTLRSDLFVNQAPDCTPAHATPNRLWPTNRRFRPILIEGVAEPENDEIRVTLLGVTQDEPRQGLFPGDVGPDWTRFPGAGGYTDGDGHGVRAERYGAGNGRVYTLYFVARDREGGMCAGTVRVCVPRDATQGDCLDDQGPGRGYAAK